MRQAWLRRWRRIPPNVLIASVVAGVFVVTLVLVLFLAASQKDARVEFVKVAPQVLAALVVFEALLLFYKPIKEKLVPRISSVGLLGIVEITLVQEALTAAAAERRAGIRAEAKTRPADEMARKSRN
jgi:hypothetical protein